ncbi:MAG: hypothetical protein FJW37_11060 [Acidobacteria bacterium]|nr:hypothetical protein [Acidobacteriota bacterium]
MKVTVWALGIPLLLLILAAMCSTMPSAKGLPEALGVGALIWLVFGVRIAKLYWRSRLWHRARRDSRRTQ